MTKSKDCPGPEWQRGRIKKKMPEINPAFFCYECQFI